MHMLYNSLIMRKGENQCYVPLAAFSLKYLTTISKYDTMMSLIDIFTQPHILNIKATCSSCLGVQSGNMFSVTTV